MIEKLKWDEQPEDAAKEVQNLIDQLVDAVNELQPAKDVMFNRIDMLNNAICDIRNRISALDDPTYHEAEPEPADPYAEQRKWIGCICRFWFDNPDNTALDYLGKIQTGENGIEYYGKETYDWFPHCEPVLPTDNAIYKGGSNE